MKKNLIYTALFCFSFLLVNCQQKVSAEVVSKPQSATNTTVAQIEQNFPDNYFQQVETDEVLTEAKIQKLFSNGFSNATQKPGKLSEILGVKSEFFRCEECKNGEYESWTLKDANLITVSMNDGLEYFSLQYTGKNEIKGLPEQLAFNGTTAEEAKYKFSRNNASIYQETAIVDDLTSRAFSVVTFDKNNQYIKLEFDTGTLTKIIVSNKEFQ